LRRGVKSPKGLDIVTMPLLIENGDLVLPKGPGWGADEEFVRAQPPRH
jgi:L-alanine-DL-glutamate epimerase-like enolase superfamily enzyme